MLKCSKYLLSSKAKKLLYFGQIHSNLSYSSSIWGSMLQSSLILKLAKVQETALRLIEPNMSVNDLFTKHKILRFTDMVKVKQCKLGYKLCHGLLPLAFAKSMTVDHTEHSITKSHRYPTRGKTIPNLPSVAGKKYRSSFLFNAIKLYSNLDKEFQSAKSLSIFVKRCKATYLQHIVNH